MSHQHVENLLIRYRNQTVSIKSMTGTVYEGSISDVTNDFVALKIKGDSGEDESVIVLLHCIESIVPRAVRG